MNELAASPTPAEVARRYPMTIVWSDEDGCYVGRCPGLFLGGCHGEDAADVLAELRQIAEDVAGDYLREGRALPEPAGVAA